MTDRLTAKTDDAYGILAETAWRESLDFIDRLPEPVRTVGLRCFSGAAPTFGRRWFQGGLFPFWIADSFGLDDTQARRDLVLGCYLGNASFLVKDDLLDRDVERTIEMEVLADLLFMGGVEYLSGLVPPSHSSKFWAHLRACFAEYARAVAWEKTTANSFRAYLPEDLMTLGSKAAPAKLPIVVCALRTERESDIEVAGRGIIHLSLGLQIIDDLQDWEADLARAHFSYPVCLAIARVMEHYGLTADEAASSSQRIGRALFLTDIVEVLLDESRQHFRHAQDLLSAFNNSQLNRYLQERIDRTGDMMTKITQEKLSALGSV